MYKICKELEVSAAHYLTLNYASKCSKLHGHNWKIRIHCKAKELNENGMVEDFTVVKQWVMDLFDHNALNDVVDFNPTAENIAKYICDNVDTAYMVEVQESEGNYAVYEKD